MKAVISDIHATAYRVPTDLFESDGTLEWDSTTLILVEIRAGGLSGIGYTYGDATLAKFVTQRLTPLIVGHDALDLAKMHRSILTTIRNEGHCGSSFMALSAVDTALWDLKAKLLDLPLCQLIGMVREEVKVYGSGGFTSYTDDQLQRQLGDWAGEGFSCVKMKIGRHPDRDVERVASAREAIGKGVELFVDANGAYTVRQSLALAERVKEYGVTWFEEPVSSDDLPGLKFIREHGPISMRTAAGEYGYAPGYFLRMLQSEAVDVLQADATRCGGITGVIKVGQLCEVFQVPFSFHCAPALHLHAALGMSSFCIGEYFHDHARIERLFFDGVAEPENGVLRPDLSRPGLGLDFKYKDAEGYRVV